MKYFQNNSEVKIILQEPNIDFVIENGKEAILIKGSMSVKTNKESKDNIEKLINELENIKKNIK